MQRTNNLQARAPRVPLHQRNASVNRNAAPRVQINNRVAQRASSNIPVNKPAFAKVDITKPQINSKQANKAAKEANFECPVCLTFCAEPVKTQCGHFFCMQCQKSLMQKGNNSCPMCRAFFDKAFIPKVDHELALEAQKFNQEEFEERKAELIDEGQWFGDKGALIKFMMGNQYEFLKNPTQKAQGNFCHHRWAMFLTLNNDKALTERYIKEVTYQLHPTYKINKITVKEAPFMLSKVAWGSFEIGCTIVFQDWCKTKPFVLEHQLSFNPETGGEMTTKFIDGKAEDTKKHGLPSKAEKDTLGKIMKQFADMKLEQNPEGY